MGERYRGRKGREIVTQEKILPVITEFEDRKIRAKNVEKTRLFFLKLPKGM